MTPQEALAQFLALKLHFSSQSYDYFKYQGRIKKVPDISKRKDRFQIQKIAKHVDPMGLMLSNLILNHNIWTGDVISAEGFANYNNWRKRMESMTYTFKEDIKKLDKENIVENFKVVDNNHPLALRLYLGEHICLETLVITNILTNFLSHWQRHLAGDLVWEEIKYQIPKYQPFVIGKFNKEKAVFKDILLNK